MDNNLDDIGGAPDIGRAVDNARDTVRTAVTESAARVADVLPDADDLRAGVSRVGSMIKENPVGMALGAVAVGFLIGLALPKTSIESDRVKDIKQMAKDAGAQVVEAGKQMVRDTLSSALGKIDYAEKS